jgi:hypothetical protein
LLSFLLVSVIATAGTAYVAEPARDASIQNGGAISQEVVPQEIVALADTSANTGTVTGRVFSQINGAVVEFAVVEIVAQDRVISALSDRSGRYRLDYIPPGSRLIRARALDHAELVIGVRVPPRGVVSLDLTLAVQPIEMAPLSARTSRVDAEPVEKIGIGAEETRTGTPADAELRVLESSPGMAELGLVQIIQAASNPDPDDPSSILYVRGATSDLKLVLLDGAPVYAPFHLGGLIQAFMPGVLGYSRPYVGGAPARFDGGLSYILDLGSRPGRTDRFHTSGALDMMSTRGEVEGPLPGGSFLLGGRYIHGEGPDRLTGEELPYDYGDALLRMDWGVGREGRLSVTGFYNREGVDLTRDGTAAGTENAIADEEPNAGDLVPDPPAAREARPKSVAEWGNVAGSVRYFGRAFDSDLELTAALGEFTTSLPLDGATPLLVDGSSRRMRLAGIMSRWIGGTQLELGASFDRVSLQHAARSTLDQTSTTFSSRNAGESVGAHAEATMRVLPAVMVRGGLRADYFLADGLRVAPRLSVAWTFLRDSEISVGAGRYHQRVLSPETLLSSEIGSFVEIASEGPGATTTATNPSALQVSSSTHFVAGINSSALEHFVVGLEGYVKSFEELPVGPDLETSGLDFWIQRSAGKVSGWVGYSVAWYRPEYEGRKAVPRTLGRQLLSGGLSAQLVSGFGVDLNLAYGVALPFTPIPQGDKGGDGNDFGGGNSPAPLLAVAAAPGRTDLADTSPLAGAARGSYLRLDGTIYRTWVFNWNGLPVTISPYIRILNALDRRDGLFFQFDPDEDRTPVSLGSVPLIPLIGVRWGL